MRGKPLIERLVPGIAVQIQKEGNVWLADLNPYVGYRFTGKLTGGAGWNQRVGYDIKQYSFNSQTRVFGPRIFAEYNVWKGICPRIEAETVNAFVPPFNKLQPHDLGTRQWVPGVFVGLKKDYTFIRNVKGTAMVMARVFDHHHTSPYGDVLNIRFGFEFPMKKKVKS